MSRENVETARRGYEAFVRGDIDAALEGMDPEVEWHNPAESPEAGVHRGYEAVKRDWAQTSDFFEDFAIELEQFFDAGDEVVVFLRYRGRGRGSGVEVDARMAHVLTVRDGKAIRVRQFLDRAAALEAAGLSQAAIE